MGAAACLRRLQPERVHQLLQLILGDRAALVEVDKVENFAEPAGCRLVSNAEIWATSGLGWRCAHSEISSSLR